MRIVLDLQGYQTASGLRGIGRYSLALAKAMIHQGKEHEFILALNGLLPESVDRMRREFSGLLPNSAIRVWTAPGPVCEREPNNAPRRDVAEILREGFLASLSPDVVHVSSLFEGYVDDGVTSIGRFATDISTVVTLYDLIPLINPAEAMSRHPGYEAYYRGKVAHLRRARHLLTISESSRQEAFQHLGISAQQATNISTAADAIFRPLELDAAQQVSERRRLGVSRPFVLYVGTADARKNLPRLIQAYALLPAQLRLAHQLVIAGGMPAQDRTRLLELAALAGLQNNDLHLTGAIGDDDLVLLNNLCRLAVMPSLHEGFGLPALEAMACGAAVIASGTTSLPEVVGREDALFDPLDVQAIMRCMATVLSSEERRTELAAWGLQRAALFSWDSSAQRALAAMEIVRANDRLAHKPSRQAAKSRPLLAYVSPMPPERTGIADYSLDLLPELLRHYDVEIIAPQESVATGTPLDQLPLRSPAWFRDNALRYERVVYQVGNSPFHSHMFDLIRTIPGLVVLHDFFLGNVFRYDEINGRRPLAWTRELLLAHGYRAVIEAQAGSDPEAAMLHYPVNQSVLQRALGVIVHSHNAVQLGQSWYGEAFCANWFQIPLLRTPAVVDPTGEIRANVRRTLGVPEDAFLVCSFGMLGPAKLNDRLLSAWLKSPLAGNARCRLVFVGQNEGGDYGHALVRQINSSTSAGRIEITGWTSAERFRQYLQAADLGVQLRARSRGETSAAALDCMNYGLATLVNAHGSMAELPDDCVMKLQDAFTDEELAAALEGLHEDAVQSQGLGTRARDYVQHRHHPQACARSNFVAIEAAYARHAYGPGAAMDCLASASAANVATPATANVEDVEVARAMALNHPLPERARRVYLDVTGTAQNGLKTGIERFARSLCLEAIDFMGEPGCPIRVYPIRLSSDGGRWHYRHACRFTLGLLGQDDKSLEDSPIQWARGDLVLGLDISGDTLVSASRQGLFREMRSFGVGVYRVVHDILPVLLPQYFPPGANEDFQRWLQCIVRDADGVLTGAQAVMPDIARYVREQGPYRSEPLKLSWFHHGSDLQAFDIGAEDPDEIRRYATALSRMQQAPTFLMVGTIEPRKGHLQAIAAFEQLWEAGIAANLVIAGREGWQGLPANARRTIPEIMNKIGTHPALGQRLFFLSGISDALLQRLYKEANCLLAASEGEGFGLPLAEAALHGLPLLVRDLPVFHEVAGENARYFSGMSPSALAQSLREWIEHPERRIEKIDPRMTHVLTWRDATKRVMDVVLNDRWEASDSPDQFVYPGSRLDHESHRLRWTGFSEAEEHFRWSIQSEAGVDFTWGGVRDLAVSRVTLVFGTNGRQRVMVSINGNRKYEAEVSGDRETITLALAEAPSRHCIVQLHLPDSRPPNALDPRPLGVCVRELRFD